MTGSCTQAASFSEVQGSKLIGRVNGQPLFQVEDDSPLTGGAVALLVEEGRVGCDQVEVGSAT